VKAEVIISVTDSLRMLLLPAHWREWAVRVLWEQRAESAGLDYAWSAYAESLEPCR
jgi:hypothetical protein